MFNDPFDPWGSPPKRDGCLSVSRVIPGPGTLADGDTYVASDGTYWRRVHSMVDAASTSPVGPKRYLRGGMLCDHQ